MPRLVPVQRRIGIQRTEFSLALPSSGLVVRLWMISMPAVGLIALSHFAVGAGAIRSIIICMAAESAWQSGQPGDPVVSHDAGLSRISS